MARIAGVNIPQNKIVQVGLTYIYGIGNKFSKQICKDLDISKSTRVNQLTDDQILKIREYIDKKKPHHVMRLLESGSSCWARTSDLRINSPSLYQLS